MKRSENFGSFLESEKQARIERIFTSTVDCTTNKFNKAVRFSVVIIT